MLRTFTCILCPQGCEIQVELQEETASTRDRKITGNRCPRGAAYVTQEIEAPVRNIATSVLVEGGELPLASVRLTRPAPRERLFDVMGAIKKVKVAAPVREGTVVINDVLGLGSDVIVTKPVERGSCDRTVKP